MLFSYITTLILAVSSTAALGAPTPLDPLSQLQQLLAADAKTTVLVPDQATATALYAKLSPETYQVVVILPPDVDGEASLATAGRSGCAALMSQQTVGWLLQTSPGCWDTTPDPTPLASHSEPALPTERQSWRQSWRPTNREQPPIPDHSAMIAYGAAYGAYAGGMSAWLVGEALEANETDHLMQGVAPAALGGGATGATVAYLLSQAKDRSPEAVALLYSSTGLGFYYGQQIGRTLIPPDAPGARERIRAAGLAGTMAGVGVGTAFSARGASVGHQIHFVGATGIGWLTGRAVGDLADWSLTEDRRQRATAETAASIGLGSLAAFANRSGLDAPRAGTIGVSVVDGAWFGGWVPFLFSDVPKSSQVQGGAELGLGLGYGAALAMTAAGQPSTRSAALQGIGLAAGSALGAGLPLSVGAEGPARSVVGPMLAAGAAGQVLGAAVAPHYKVDAADRLLLGSLESWTAYQAIGWSVLAGQTGATNTQAIGYALSAGGAGTLVSMGLIPALDVSPQGSVMLLSGGAWGTWFGAWGSQIAGSDADGLWLASLSAGDGALLASAVAQGAGWQPTWRQVAAMNGFGLLGAAAGGLVGTVALYDPNDWTPVSASVVAGSGAGLIAGGIIGSRPKHRSDTSSTRSSAGTRSDRRGLASKLPFSTQLQATPWAGDDGQPGLWVQLDLTER